MSVFSAELTAILVALQHILVSNHRHFYVYTDSMSALESLHSLTERTHPIVMEILLLLRKLERKGFDIIFSWVPGYVGILGNEQADNAARSMSDHMPQPVYKSICKIWSKVYLLPRGWSLAEAMDVAGEQGQGHRWPYEGPRMGDANLLASEDVDVFFHSLDSNGNPVNPATYYASPAAARAVHSYRPTHARMPSSQMCRPHFHTPLHPWISEGGKPMVPHPAHGSAWCSAFSGKPPHHPSGSSGPLGVHAPPHTGSLPPHSSPHLFSFPPTPPKDATPDTVSGAGTGHASVTDYGGNSASIVVSSSNSSEDIKGHHTPNMITSLGSNCGGKPREGSTAFSSALPPVHHHHHQPSHHHHHHMPTYSSYVTAPPQSGGSADYSGAGYHFPGSFLGSSTAKSSSSLQNSGGSSSGKPRSKGRSSADDKNLWSGYSRTLTNNGIVLWSSDTDTHYSNPCGKTLSLSLLLCICKLIPNAWLHVLSLCK
ncbi:GATA-binding factor 3 [Trichonephila inaurata madagascariensis]|uniref:GATA-binding factor 3 n=1 Tax=Trichonephila inaurata madagascariensis TaxID=2747483 RepID=A0A8X7CMR7_9ARAC|nr:GATA-binding factor 3 [Trichonephila inaurata madagascariensis]